MTRADFLRAVRGKPYDRDALNCWQLASLTQWTLFGRVLPVADPALVADVRERVRVLATHPERANWREIAAPVDGALVLMGRGPGKEEHCGTWLADDGGLILHTDEPHGVVLDPPLEIVQARRWRLTYLVPVGER
ncbi:glycoside hydrolase [Methylobacterium sp. ID0610]|uniref:glycoside hydrolase n=1 Tax=Methylobacterium carpenticola TaxID=3344827 RepID=UPI0036A0E2AA